ncbi:MAG: O-antigen ligase family protein [Opitutales bacterium]|nr:O-antigen ligase family protein [Opitutales bacterium]
MHLNLVLWVGGGTLLWVEWASLSLGLLLFAFAALAYPDGLEAAERPIRRLIRFPFFWLGLALLAYVAIQAQNVAWERVQVGRVTGMRPIEGAVPWLPQGFVTPLEQENPFRWMLRLIPAWLAFCAVWIGLRGRSGALFLALLLGASLVVWSGVAFYQAFSGATHILGIWEVRQRHPNHPARFWGTFVHAGHGALMMILGQALLLSLFLRLTRRRFETRGQIMGPAFLLLPLALTMAAGVLMILSRGGIVILVAFYLSFLGLSTVALARIVGWKACILPTVTLVLLTGASWTVLQNPDNWDRLQRRWAQVERTAGNIDTEARVWVSRIALDMIEDRPRFGWGAGGWRYFYPPYKIYYPELASEMTIRLIDPETGTWQVNERGRPVWHRIPVWYRQAHNDWLELIVELGWTGASLVFFGVGLWGIWVIVVGWRDPALLMLAAGPVGLLVASAWEFHLRIPAPLLWTGVVMALCLAWGRRRDKGRRRISEG